jgi:hypothetical protein
MMGKTATAIAPRYPAIVVCHADPMKKFFNARPPLFISSYHDQPNIAEQTDACHDDYARDDGENLKDHLQNLPTALHPGHGSTLS